MATLTPTLALTSTDATSDSLSFSVTDTLTIGDLVTQTIVATSTTATKFLEADDYTDSYVSLHNKSTNVAEDIYIRFGATSADDALSLDAGEFAFFPWAADLDICYDAASGTPSLEVKVFQKN